MKIILLLLSILCLFSCKQHTKISEWRGPNRSGIYNESNLLKEWPEDGPKLIWESEEFGNGYGSPVFVDDIFYMTGEIDSVAYLYKSDFKGNILWKAPFGNEWIINFPGSRSAPTVVGDMIYLLTGQGDLSCIDAQNGDLIWQENILKKYDGENTRFGLAQAIYVDGDKLFCMPGGKKNNLIALNRFSGNLIWSCKAFGERPAYNSPQMITVAERRILVTFSAYHLIGVDTESGEMLWSHEQTNLKPEDRKPGMGDTHSNTIIYENGHIYYAAGDGNCGVKLQLSEDGTAIKEVWKNKNFDSYMGGLVKIDDKLYGDGTRKPFLKSIDANSGEMDDSLKIGNGALIAADNMLYFYNNKGQVHLVDYSNDKLKSVSSFKINKGRKEHFAHPAIHQGMLFVRHGNYLGVFDIQKEY